MMLPAHEQDKKFMDLALEEAKKAFSLGEVPVGAILVHEGQILAQGHNRREWEQDPTAHAELFIIQQAARRLHSWRLLHTTLYVTLEPCLMCTGAMLQARISRLVFGTFDPKGGACGSLYRAHQDSRLNHQMHVIAGVQQEHCQDILKQFFREMRKKRAASII